MSDNIKAKTNIQEPMIDQDKLNAYHTLRSYLYCLGVEGVVKHNSYTWMLNKLDEIKPEVKT